MTPARTSAYNVIVHAVTLAYMDPAIVEASIEQFVKTAGAKPDHWLMVPHYWPIETLTHFQKIGEIAERVGAEVHNPTENLGGTGGYNWAFGWLAPRDEDFILTFDGDSYPITEGWLKALVDVLKGDPTLACASLWPAPVVRSDGEVHTVAGHRVRVFPMPEMMSVTLWRASFFRTGIVGHFAWYGQIEIPMFYRARGLGLKIGYLETFRESANPIPHPKIYTEWKRKHVSTGYKGNFDEYVKEHS